MRGIVVAATALAMSGCGVTVHAGSGSVQRALNEALSGTNAVGVVLDGRDGQIVAAVRQADAGRVASAPGSTLKPLFLSAALREGRVRAETTVVCHGDLRIAGRDVACTHPRERNVFDAEQALAYSCNTWFANLARRFSPAEAAEVVRSYGFGSRTGLVSGDAAGEIQVPRNDAEVQLLVLGLSDIRVTPLQLVRAYFRLARENTMPVVQRGLEGSVAYGMAHNAATAGLAMAGKTGTASDAGESWTHGWFAGIASRGPKSVAVVVYVRRGNGGDAAGLAHRFFLLWEREE
jgi:cell division protein FtsI/penicillin-binding protein 2